MPKIKIAFEMDHNEFHVVLGKREGDPRHVTIDVTKLPENALAAIFHYGMQRKFNDASGGADKTIDDKVKIVEEMRDRFYAGEVSKPRGSGEGKPAWWRFAADALRKVYLANPANKAAWKELDADARSDIIDRLWDNQKDAARASVQAYAEAKLAAEQEAARKTAKLGIDINLK